MKYWAKLSLAFVSIGAFIAIAATLETTFGISFDLTYRVACAAACLLFIFKFTADYPAERWPRLSFKIALFVNIALFFTPITSGPSSRGEIMMFALPDAIIVLMVAIHGHSVADAHQRAVRQQMMLGLVVAVIFCTFLFAMKLTHPEGGRGKNLHTLTPAASEPS